jgi:uncharacterized phage protein (TIGR02218 family)
MRPVTLNAGFVQADFDALLASRQFAYAEAFTLRLVWGTVLHYAGAQQSFTAPACDGSGLTTYVANDVLVDGVLLKCSSGQSASGDPTVQIVVDEQSVTFTPNANLAQLSLIDGVPFLQAVARGALDGAVVQRDRWFFAYPGSPPVGGVPMFYGFTASIDKLSRTQAVMKVKSDLVLLDIRMPRNLYQPNCNYTIYDQNCGVAQASYVNHAAVGASPTTVFIPWTGASAQFTGGLVTFSSGPCVNLSRTIKSADTTGLTLAYPLPEAPLAGDLFAAYPGCDRTYGGGCAYFANQSRFRATPNVPPPEMAV